MSRPALLDLFCGAGGCSVGYHRAGFDVVGVDHKPQKRYPYTFIEGDALATLRSIGDRFDAIHASPPCQHYSRTMQFAPARKKLHPDLVPETRRLLIESGKPWVIENVVGSPLAAGSCMLCGLSFGLKVFRHRMFEASFLLFSPSHRGHGDKRIGKGGYCSVFGDGGTNWSNATREYHRVGMWREAMGIDWMTLRELAQAIPPDYTEFVGKQLLSVVEARL